MARNRYTMTKGADGVRGLTPNRGVTGAPGEDPYDLDLKEIARQRAREKSRAQLQQNATNFVDESKPLPDGLDELSRTRFEQARERKARVGELDAEKARALQSGAARSGLAGMGLSGAASALQSDIGRQQDRSRTLALADLERGFRGETQQIEDRDRQRQFQDEDRKFLDISRDVALIDLEDTYEMDIDGDGFLGDPAQKNRVEDVRKETEKEDKDARAKALRIINTLGTLDHSLGDAMTGPGTKEVPYVVGSAEDRSALEAAGYRFTPAGNLWNGEPLYKDDKGTFYVLR